MGEWIVRAECGELVRLLGVLEGEGRRGGVLGANSEAILMRL